MFQIAQASQLPCGSFNDLNMKAIIARINAIQKQADRNERKLHFGDNPDLGSK